MRFRISPAPYQRTKRTTRSIMLELSAVLLVVWIAAIIFYFAKVGAEYGIRVILIGVIALATAFVTDSIIALIYKKKGKEVIDYFLNSYSYVTALIFALIIPASTPYFAVVVSIIFGIVIAKVVFGGFGYNIANPAGVSRIFAVTAFSLGTVSVTGLVADYASGATVTSNMNWITGLIPGGFTELDLFLGNYIGSIGETCTLLLIICGIYLAIRKVIDARLTISYLATIYIIALALALIMQVDYPLSYANTHLFTGGVMFGAVFMITDPVTTPTSPLGKIIFGICAAALTMVIRLCGALPEGVIFSIVIMNLFTPTIDKAIAGTTKFKVGKQWLILTGFLLLAVLVNWGLLWIEGIII